MGINIELAKKAEKIAKEISKEKTGTDAMWELCLTQAYEQLTKMNK